MLRLSGSHLKEIKAEHASSKSVGGGDPPHKRQFKHKEIENLKIREKKITLPTRKYQPK